MKNSLIGIFLILLVAAGSLPAQQDSASRSHDGFQATVIAGGGRMFAWIDANRLHEYLYAGVQGSMGKRISLFDVLSLTPRAAIGGGLYPDMLNEPQNNENMYFLLLELGCAVHLGEHAYVPLGFTCQKLFGDARLILHESTSMTDYWLPKTLLDCMYFRVGYGYKYTRFSLELTLHFDLSPSVWSVPDYYFPMSESWRQNDRKTLLDVRFAYDL